MERTNDTARLCGTLAGKPELSHIGRDGAYYRFPLSVTRLSGTADTVNVIAGEELLSGLELEERARLLITGEVRSYNNRSGKGAKLVITVAALTMELTDEPFDNRVRLCGTICREPNFRKTPMGRRICDIMLAVNRPRGRSDYIPCIAWGALAESAGEWTVGTDVELLGRLQSRDYIKNEDGVPVRKTAFEVSASEIAVLGDGRG